MSIVLKKFGNISEIKRNILIITLVYIASQSLLLIVTGRWWDDWCYYNQRQEDLIKIASETGRLSLFFIIRFAKLFPENGYRILTYFMCYLGTLFFYGILRRTLKITNKACCMISCLYTIIPVNDARIMLCVFLYTVGLFFFLAGFYLLTHIVGGTYKKVIWRIIDIILFWFSYTLNSNLILYAIPLFYIAIHENTLRKFVKYIDYLLLPVVFYLGKKIIFTPYGGYEGYNNVSVSRFVKGIVNIIPADVMVILRVVYKLLICGFIPIIIMGVLIFIVNASRIKKIIINIIQGKTEEFIESNDNEINSGISIKQFVVLLLIGGLVLSAGLFSYVVVRESYNIYITGLEGRDAILVPLGASIILYALVEFIFNRRIRAYMYALIIMCGIVHFNVWYLAYQSDYYRQLGFQYQLAQHQELRSSKNMVYLSDDVGRLNRTVFYVLNANAEMVYGDQTRFIMSGFDNIDLLDGDNLEYQVKSGNYHMKDYDTMYKKIDAIVEYSNPISTVDTVKLKLYEIFNYEKFENWIYENSDLCVTLADTDEYNQKLENAGYVNIGE